MVVDAMPSSSDRMSTLLSDSRTIAGIRTFASRSRDWVIGELIRFLVLFPETDDLTECLHELAGKQDEYHDFLLRSIVRTLGLTSPFTLEKRKSILRYWFERTNLDGYMFHSFNGSLESSIRTHGIHPDERAWDPQDLRKIQAIGKLRGFSLLLNGTEDIGKIYVGSYYDKIYGYARSSPEWFAQFVAEGRNGSGYDRTAYYRRDYARAKENILLLCEEIKRESLLYSRPPLSVEEECEILSFFEKYWSLLA